MKNLNKNMYHSENYKIYSFNCNENGEASYQSLVQYMIETSIEQTNIVMKNNHDFDDYFWVIYQWDIDFIKRPKMGDEIIIETVSAGAKKFYAYRNFTIFDEEGNVFVQAKSKWLLLNKNRKMPVRVPDELINLYGKDESLEVINGEFDFNKDLEFTTEMDFRIRKSDIDTNKHVNNAKYIDWILETFNGYKKIDKIQLTYKKETRYGEEIKSKSTELLEENGNKVMYNIIEDSEGNVKTLSKIYLGD
ncbi:MAG: acyl-ACP thioesterase domain-containing protein [Miniphocaeibacter sp.]|uniref:acyl-[acyl-carrier-protein] thioesterase n=1 Tax=Miniphocaeibacter sp. TaxID=3100973 RepID=UPI0017E690DD|nr:hypothetical protein [Gallicola sp.]